MSEKKVILKVNLKHPAKSFQLGRYRIGQIAKEYSLNESEQKELQGKGPKKWLIIVEAPAKKTPASKKEKDSGQ